MRHNFLLTLLLCSPLLVTGCGDTNDPAISNPVITTTAIAPTTLSISWTKATDSNTSASALMYKIYVSAPNPAYQSFDTLGEVEAGTLVQTLTDAGSATITTSITANSAHYINIVVEDEDGNKARYESLGEYFHASQISYYPFNGNTNDVETTTPNNLVLAVDLALPTLAFPTVTSDRFLHAGSAYSFNPATPQCLQSSANVGITGSNPRTVSFWVQSANTPTGTQRAAFAWGNENLSDTSFRFRESGLAANWTVRLGTGNDVSTSTPATANWEHWVVGSSGGSLSGYRNGVAVTIPAATVNTTNSLLYVGCGIINATTGLGNLYQGNIDDVRIFNALLDGTDVARLYRVTRP